MRSMAKILTDFSVAAILNLNKETKENDVTITDMENNDITRNDILNTDSTIDNDQKPSVGELSPERKKKSRTVFTRRQIQKLENAFDRKKYFTNAERQKLAVDLALSETQVKIWLQNRRNKWKKQINYHQQITKNLPTSPPPLLSPQTTTITSSLHHQEYHHHHPHYHHHDTSSTNNTSVNKSQSNKTYTNNNNNNNNNNLEHHYTSYGFQQTRKFLL